MTNTEFFDSIYKPYQKEHYSSGTYFSRTSLLKNHFLPTYGGLTPADISYLDINHVYDDLEDLGFAENTIFGLYASLLSYFKLAISVGEAGDNPTNYSRPIRPACGRSA